MRYAGRGREHPVQTGDPVDARAIPCLGPRPDPPDGWTWDALMACALEEAARAAARNEIPVGALVVHASGRVLARARNSPLARHDPTAHAEILALRRAGKALGNYRLNNCVLVVTLEPCAMCAAALVHARVDGVVFGAADAVSGAVLSCDETFSRPYFNHHVWHMGGIGANDCAALLHAFFTLRRTP